MITCQEVAVYQGDEQMAVGTYRECAEQLGVGWRTIQFLRERP